MTGRLVIAVTVVLLAGCGPKTDYGDFVARVGTQTLTREDLAHSLDNRPYSLDSIEAASQIIEQWVTNELLFQEALDRGLRNDPEVLRLLAENERSVIISALVNQMYDEDSGELSEGAVQTYYEQHRAQLALREPFARLRYLTVADADTAAMLVDSLRADLDDERFEDLARRYSLTPDASVELASGFYPVSQLFGQNRVLHDAVAGLGEGQILRPIELDGLFHIAQIVDRVEAGTLPDLEMIAGDIAARVGIESRKQLFARQVQRLRTQALAREDLEIR